MRDTIAWGWGLCWLAAVGCGGNGVTGSVDDGGADVVSDTSDAASDVAPVCDVGSLAVDLSTDDPYAYPPYALDGCAVAYVTKAGAIHLRDLGSGADELVDPGPARRPTLAGTTLAWETVGATPTVRVRAGSGAIVTLPGRAGEPRAARDAVVFTRFLGDALADTDVQLYVPSTGVTTPVGVGPGQQRFADVDDDWVAFTDFSEDPDGRFDGNETDLADVVLYERRTGKLSPRKRKGKQAFPLLVGGGQVVYHEWDFIHPQPKLEVYELFRGALGAATDADVRLASVVTAAPYVRPAGRGGVVEWVVRDLGGVITLFRARVAGGATETVTGLAATDLLAPAAAADRTAIGVRGSDGALVLRFLRR